jgi:predicted  nucleic acid-binding Zn-ribbon protein
MAQTAEERKIKRLENELAKYKGFVKDLQEEKRVLEYRIDAERRWRMDFQKLMKATVQEDTLTDYERSYY